ncbi:MAG TPA: hypothetical protein D7I06_08980 [Candidatus Poseidoniales archaeon]|nr:MAG TPA: hypothetical protein D7I06_08980 [Candidatus Poseidoniales archaeon]DAC64305.1 MAG TPA: hypothetical protein D7I10_00325 [Candidatus Poseidoniales archaeon]HIH80867.1 hypothetical protein [Candidatus Thalassarchaeaceae archaeon]HII63726.1 hypothetical protein [Candidatus Poseidoniaceae archaeon]|tara:strand:+ start:335 stop:784 length:450 start_codon:yes stop_codon:yes gene_type:complete
MSNNLLILFGTETGNAEDLAFDAGKLASDFDLESEVKGMDEVSLDDVTSCGKLMIVCSTWGEGDQPDNAQDLFDEVSESDDGCMSDVSFAVLALGDTAFEMFCQSGKEWDQIIEKKGGSRVYDRIDCDTDYEDEAEEWIESALKALQSS